METCVWTDRHINRHGHHNTPLHYGSGVINMSNRTVPQTGTCVLMPVADLSEEILSIQTRHTVAPVGDGFSKTPKFSGFNTVTKL